MSYRGLISLTAIVAACMLVPPASSTAQTDTYLLPENPVQLLPVAAMAFFPSALRLPESYDSSRAYPLLIGLHGFGGSAERFMSNWNAFSNPGFIYVCPQAPYPAPQSTWLGYSWAIFGTENPELERQSQVYARQYVQTVVNGVQEQYKISNVYLLGFSQGGMMAYDLAFGTELPLAGIACIASPLPDQWYTEGALSAARKLPVFIAHGTDDPDVPVEVGRAAQLMLAGNSYDVEYSEFTGGHTFLAETLRLVEIWLDECESRAASQ